MKKIKSGKQLKKICNEVRSRGKSVGFVPTMGALHEGHLSLVRRAAAENDFTVCSIFVNPKQFGPREDFNKYPRTLKEDCRLLALEKTDIVFVPEVEAFYDSSSITDIRLDPKSHLVKAFCGQYRPGHFEGVATVITKFWNILGDHTSYFGAKDYQQGLIVQKLAKDLNFPVDVKMCPIVREKEGLAMSSRNQYLTVSERACALNISKQLRWIKKECRSGWDVSFLKTARKKLEKHLKVQYLEARDAKTLESIGSHTHKIVVGFAGFVGKTRLIDNVTIVAPSGSRKVSS